jgi:glutamate/tyrosine decarboxylase-like PLP-dependent enzyme
MMLDQENLNLLNEIILNYLSEIDNNDVPVIKYRSANDLKKELSFSLPKTQQDINSVFNSIKDYLEYSQRTLHPQFNNQLYSAITAPAFMGEVISALTNTSMATFEIAPVATLMEKKMIEKLNSYVGYKGDEGIMCTGGSNANMLALHCARAKDDPKAYDEGNSKRYAVFVSEVAHYSFEKAITLMGLGLNSLKKVKASKSGKMLTSDLIEKIKEAKENGETPLLIASTAGTTVKGAFDLIKEIDQVAKENQIWHHIDGAWGGSALLSKNTKKLLEGCELSDSFTWDAHKLMGTGLITSFFLTKHEGILKASNSTAGGNVYIFHDYENKEYDTGPHSLQCGRKVDILKLWLSWQYFGDEGYEEYMNNLVDNKNYFVEKLKSYPDKFQLIHEPEFLNVCFQVIPSDDSDINEFNFKKRFELSREGHFQVNFSRDDEVIYFRHVFANINVTKKDIDRFVERLLSIR